MSGAVPSLSNTPSWRGAQLKRRDNLTLPYRRHEDILKLKADSVQNKISKVQTKIV
jgi:hypothetical protein